MQSVSKELFEVIVSDDGSLDNTKLVTDSFSKVLNIKYVYQEDYGYRPGSARNNGIENSSGKICLFVDSGILLGEDCVRKHIEFHKQRNCDSAAIGYIYGFEENDYLSEELKQIINISAINSSISNLSLNPLFLDIRETQYKKYNYRIEDLPAPWLYFWGGHLSILKKNLEFHQFDFNYDGKWGVEDNDLGYQLHQYGIKICLLRSAESIHYPHPKIKEARHLEGYENCIYFNKKFNSLETQLFLDHFLGSDFVDINELSIKYRNLLVNSAPI